MAADHENKSNAIENLWSKIWKPQQHVVDVNASSIHQQQQRTQDGPVQQPRQLRPPRRSSGKGAKPITVSSVEEHKEEEATKEDSTATEDQAPAKRLAARHIEPTQVTNFSNPAIAAGLMLTGLYWGIRGTLKVFHTTRRRMLRELLFDLCTVLNTSDFTYWLDFGSLLGVYRDGDLILHDNDIDLVVLDPDWSKLFEIFKTRLGGKYCVRYVTPSEDNGTTFMRVYCLLGMADIFGAISGGPLQRCQDKEVGKTEVTHQAAVCGAECPRQDKEVGKMEVTHQAAVCGSEGPRQDKELDKVDDMQQGEEQDQDMQQGKDKVDCKVDKEDCKVDKEDYKVDKEDCKVDKEGYKVDKEDYKVDKEGYKVDKEDYKVDKEDYKVDKEDGNLHIMLGHGDCCDIPESLVLPSTTLKFRGVDVRIPGKVEAALKLRYGDTWMIPRYMDKGSDVVEQQKLYARVFTTLGKLGIRI